MFRRHGAWHASGSAVADRNLYTGARTRRRADIVRTAKNCWLRAADYYRQAEFFPGRRRSATAGDVHEDGAREPRFLAHLTPPGEVLEISYEGASLMRTSFAHLLKARLRELKGAPPARLKGRASGATAIERQPCLISMGDSTPSRTRLVHAGARRAARASSVLMIDGPGRAGRCAVTA